MPEHANDYQYWSKTADRFDVASTYIVGAKAQDAAKSWLKNQLTVMDIALEIGCGTGFFSREIAEKVQHLTATDKSQEMLTKEQAKLQAFPNIDVRVRMVIEPSIPRRILMSYLWGL
jgi:ubiquinone/menaquinone biosynthesis C-methylase UbiE